jgi:hypothetical protein
MICFILKFTVPVCAFVVASLLKIDNTLQKNLNHVYQCHVYFKLIKMNGLSNVKFLCIGTKFYKVLGYFYKNYKIIFHEIFPFTFHTFFTCL